MMHTFNIKEAKKYLSRLLEEVNNVQESIIAGSVKPIAMAKLQPW